VTGGQAVRAGGGRGVGVSVRRAGGERQVHGSGAAAVGTRIVAAQI
jgi:hypothetical protein